MSLIPSFSRNSKDASPQAQAQASQLLYLESCHTSEEKAPHSPANALAVIEDVELVHKLVHGVAGLGDGAQICHEPHIIALLEKSHKKAALAH